MRVAFTCNGKAVDLEIVPDLRALDLIRERLDLTGTKEGCGRGECGACTIIVDGEPANACLLYAAKLEGTEVLTVEGLGRGTTAGLDEASAVGRKAGNTAGAAEDSGSRTELHPLQEAFLAEGAVQCGYCTPGMLMSAKALLDKNENPSVEEIEEAISGNLCRCTGYGTIVAAIQRAAKEVRNG